MPATLEDKLVVAVAASALFDLRECHAVFQEQGEQAYRDHQAENEYVPLAPGTAHPFVKRLLSLNGLPHLGAPVEIVLVSRNDPFSGLRVLNTIHADAELAITRGVFTTGRAPWRYLKPFNTSLFLSANENDVRNAIGNDFAAGQVLHSHHEHDDREQELRIAFDFDGVLADDTSERLYKEEGLEAFLAHEENLERQAMKPGPFADFFRKLGEIWKAEHAHKEKNPSYVPRLRIAIVTARNSPSDRRVIRTLQDWGVEVDETLFLGGLEKAPFLAAFDPHIFFDDQPVHAKPAAGVTPSVHVPFGKSNEPTE